MKRLYFAHPVSDYGMPREMAAEAAIAARFPDVEILNPNGAVHEAAYNKMAKETGSGMAYFEDLARTCQILVAVPFEDGEWGMGVFKEIEAMARSGGEVFAAKEGAAGAIEITALDYTQIRPLSIAETRTRLKAWRAARAAATAG